MGSEKDFGQVNNAAARTVSLQMLRKNPEERVVVTGILSHSWIAQQAEHSLIRCTAALLDWQSLRCAQSSTCSSFHSTDRSASSGESQSTSNGAIVGDSISTGD